MMMSQEGHRNQYHSHPSQTVSNNVSSSSAAVLTSSTEFEPSSDTGEESTAHDTSSNPPPIRKSPRHRNSSRRHGLAFLQNTIQKHRPPPKRSEVSFFKHLKVSNKGMNAVSAHNTRVTTSTQQQSTITEETSIVDHTSVELPRNRQGSISNSISNTQEYLSEKTSMVATQKPRTKHSDRSATTVEKTQVDRSARHLKGKKHISNIDTTTKHHSSAVPTISILNASPYHSVNTFNQQNTKNDVKRMIITPSSTMRGRRPFPFICSSFIPYSQENNRKDTEEDLPSSASTPLSATNMYPTGEDESYRRCFPDTVPHDSYDPYFLDDPNIRGSKQKKVMIMKGMITSTIPYVRSRELKHDLNDQFKKKHSAWFNKKTELTLSMIRQIKHLMVETMDVASGQVIEYSTVAMAIVYFEKLVLQNLVTKQNRKVLAATCLFLAFKFNSDSGGTKRKQYLQWFFGEIEHHFGISKKALFQNEFSVLVSLKFDLNVDSEQWMPHYQRMLL